MRVLIVYGTTDGMTARIAERMAQVARKDGHHLVELVNAAAWKLSDPAEYDAVLVGASLHAGGFQRAVHRFVKNRRDGLERRPSAFFSVCLAIASPSAAERREAVRLAEAFPIEHGWKPMMIEVFAGAVMFSRYGFLRRFELRHLAEKELGEELDVTRDQVFTDWPAVDRFVHKFLGRVTARFTAPAADSGA